VRPALAVVVLLATWFAPTGGPAAFPIGLLRWLGLMAAPGAILYLLAERRRPTVLEFLLAALVASPLLVTLAGMAGLAAGAAPGTIARAIAVASLLALGAVAAARHPPLGIAPRREWMVLLALTGVAVLLTAFLPATREWWRIRSDAWFHAAVVAQIDRYGIPPEDPYFAGLPLQYMWFYHVLVLVLARGLDADPFRVMALVNVQALVVLAFAAHHLAGVFRDRVAHRAWATAMLLFAFNAAFWVLLPVKLARVMIGDVRGMEEVRRTFQLFPLTYDRACGFMHIYYNQEFFLDKFMVATAFGFALACMATGWYAATAWMRERRPSLLVLLAVSLGGMLGFHSLVGFVMLVGIFGGCILLFFARRGAAGYRMRDSLLLLGVSLACFLATTPYLYQVMHMKEREQVIPLSVSLHKTAGIFISSAFVLALCLRARGRALLGEATAAMRFFGFAALSVTLFCLLIKLPGPNTYDKLGYFVFIPMAVAAGLALADELERRSARARTVALAWTLAFLVPVNLIAFASCFLTPDAQAFTTEEARLSDWIRDHTGRDALMIDDHDRVVFLVTAPRRYFWGNWAYAQQWGYPRLEMSRRLHAQRALYSGDPLDATALEVLGAVQEPLYAVVRPEHRTAGSAVTTRPDLFPPVHEDGGYGIVRIDTAACRAAATAAPAGPTGEKLIQESGL
jgi:hypothetical protein